MITAVPPRRTPDAGAPPSRRLTIRLLTWLVVLVPVIWGAAHAFAETFSLLF